MPAFHSQISALIGAVFGILIAKNFGMGWLAVALILFVLWMLIYAAIEHAPTRAPLRRFPHVAHHGYQRTMDRLLSALPKLLLPGTVERKPRPTRGVWAQSVWLLEPRARDSADLQRLMRNPWSWPVMDVALRVAIAYPLLLALTRAWSGNGTALGAFPLVSPDTPAWLIDATLFCGVVPLLALRIMLAVRRRSVSKKLAERLDQAAFALTISLALTLTLTFAFLFPFALAIAVASAFALSGALALAYALAVAVTSAVTFGGALGGIVAGTIGIAFAIALTATVSALTGAARGGTGYLVFASISLAAGFAAATIVPAGNDAVVFILGLTLLPLVNAIFDWLSYGLTLWLLSRAHRRGGIWPILAGVADVVAAAVLLWLVSCALVLTLALVDMFRSEPLVDVPSLLNDVQANPAENWWIIAMVASTLLPTLLHLMIALASAVTWLRSGPWNALVERLTPEVSLFASFPATLGLLALSVASLVGPVLIMFGVCWSLWTWGGGIVDVYINSLRWVGVSMGLF